MKRKDIILIVGVVLVLVVGVVAMKGTNAQKIEVPLKLSGEDTGLNEIDYETYKSKVANGENFIFIIERTGCTYCQAYMPIVEEVSNELSIPVYYINTDNVSSADISELSTTNRYLKRNSNWGTPTTILMSGEAVVDSIGGYVEKDELMEFVRANFVIEENEQ